MPAFTVAQLAAFCGGESEGDASLEIRSANALNDAQSHELSFVGSDKARAEAAQSRAGCLVVPESYVNSGATALIRVHDPRGAFARCVAALHAEPRPAPGVHASAQIALSATIAPSCTVGPNVVIGEQVTIGAGTVIGANCVVDRGATIGEQCRLYANVTVYHSVRVGNRVTMHAGCVVGADGFGFAFQNGRYEKFPQIGTVEIGDDVELGANTCVDRAALGVTRIAEGVKLDNLVHIAHNCTIGKHVVAAAQAGISGGVTVGDYAVIGGQVGIADKATIESKAVLGAQSGIVTGQTVRAEEPVWGTPARPIKKHLRQLAALGKLPELLKEVKELARRVEELEKPPS